MADLFEEMGSVAKADEIRRAGCQWVWNVWLEDGEGNPRPARVCGATHMEKAMNKLGGEVRLASETIQADRNEQARALEAIEAAMAEHGAGEVLQALARVGLVATVGHRMGARLKELPGPRNEKPPVAAETTGAGEGGLSGER